MQSKELRKKFVEFFEERGHKLIKSASLVPNDDKTVLFNVAGMQQFKKY
jgi:alanyl-tRNA synthetase